MRNLTCTLDYHARTRPEAEALVFGDIRLGWRDLQARVRQTAAGLAALGVGPDTIVAMMMKNSPAFVELTYAISHLGAVSLPVNFRLSGEEVDYITNHAGAALLIADEEFTPLLGRVRCPVHWLDGPAHRDSTVHFGGHGEVTAAHPRTGGDLFRLMYTSGTTDRPKGVTHSYDNFHWKNFDLIVALGLSAADRLCVTGPLYHVGAADLPGLAVHVMGGTLVVLRDFEAAAVLGTIEAERITGIWLAPVMTTGVLTAATKADTSTLKWCIGGGEKTPEGRIRAFADTFPNARYIDAYGMTETVSGDTLMEPGREIAKIGSVGRPVGHVRVEIRDDAGDPLPPGREGEICMAGPKVTRGYWRDAERSAAAFFADGFLRSGDVGYLDEDGFLYLTDRKKDMIISGGENIASSEVERVVYELPGVLEAAVIGRPDPRWGEVPVAVIVPAAGAEITLAALDAHCRAHLAGFKCPKDLVIAEALPRNPSGKVLKRVLRDRIVGKP